MQLSDFIVSILSGLISGVIVSSVFYYLAGKGLAAEVSELKRIIGVLSRGIESGDAKFVYDDKGSPIGLLVALKATISGSSHVSGNLSVTSPDKPEQNSDE